MSEHYIDHVLVEDGSQWPLVTYRDGDLAWQLRYGNAEMVRYQAASIVEAYETLINATGDKRALVVRALKKARRAGGKGP
jgi:hypothetical protein